jgi:hypothetical protein
MDHNDIYKFCSDYNIINLDINSEKHSFRVDTICKLEIAQSDLIKLIEFESKAKTMITTLNEENEIREKHIAVEKAYDEYKLLLLLTQKEKHEI